MHLQKVGRRFSTFSGAIGDYIYLESRSGGLHLPGAWTGFSGAEQPGAWTGFSGAELPGAWTAYLDHRAARPGEDCRGASRDRRGRPEERGPRRTRTGGRSAWTACGYTTSAGDVRAGLGWSFACGAAVISEVK